MWLHRFAVLTSASTLFLIFVGGLVTSTGSALAVPDWPLAYGQLFPKMVGGVFYEHGHRLVAATVGVLMLGLACWIFVSERRRWVGWLAACALGAVVLQGILGGLTVLLLLPTAVSVAHACLAQAFFCLTVTLAVVTGRGWMQAGAAAGAADPAGDDPWLRPLSVFLAAAVFLQLLLGAVMRHIGAGGAGGAGGGGGGAGLAIPDFPLAFGRLVPDLTSAPVAIHFAHRVWAGVVTLLAAGTIVRVAARHRRRPRLVGPAAAVAGLLPVQIGLGAFTVWSGKAVLPTTAHVVCGAAVLAASLILSLRAHREGYAARGGRAGERLADSGLPLAPEAVAP